MGTSLQHDIEQAAALLRTATDVTLLAHVRPDADALGSALALGRVLHRRGAKVRVSFGTPAEMPESLRPLDVDGLFTPLDRLPESEPLLIALDTPSPARLGVLAARVDTTKDAGGEVLVVDHHASNLGYGTRHVVDDAAEATVVLVLKLIDALGEEVDAPVATCLYAGLVTDTAGFRLAKPSTHHTAARLIEAGADPAAIARDIVDDHPFAWLPMLSSVLSTARLEPEGAQGFGFVHAVVSIEAAASVRLEEIEGVIDVVRCVRDAGVAAVLKPAGPAGWSVSLRSAGRIDVSMAAKALGGGGHRLAAGCTLQGTADEALARIREALATAPLL
ncbi:DHH family phosphoesterase [Amycolatopsis sp. CA-230715]|uniref:DHH family phosphoesterase n=1 Tax=Amycolatopsis sp. CA-230715 TaxID=2745196 RepID=UPI001C02C30C|nr:DHH family phosphoesterase [Amycolatopsis sp. CA-230715]QWF77103.1 Bifunctional oligoribonuclease and PAP phosphatase NrnA [Amycolatopsis sp. CA-230715]